MDTVFCNLCGSDQSEIISVLRKRPEKEIDYKIPEAIYYREIRRCNTCSVYFNHYDFQLLSNDFYAGFYNASIESGKLADRFDRIIGLPYESSDNKQRAERVISFIKKTFPADYHSRSVLDVGTGTGVFVHEIAKTLKNVYCVDPDKRSIELARTRIPVKDSWIGTLQDIPKSHKFDVVTYNKVLEHVLDPVALLKDTREYFTGKPLLYVELPFATELANDKLQDERAEFFIEHYTTYTKESLQFLLRASGYTTTYMDTLIEPSGKHTIYAFATF